MENWEMKYVIDIWGNWFCFNWSYDWIAIQLLTKRVVKCKKILLIQVYNRAHCYKYAGKPHPENYRFSINSIQLYSHVFEIKVKLSSAVHV